MKKQILSGVLFALLGALASTSALADVVNSKHNLGSTPAVGEVRNNTFANTTQVCVFCHTPHGSNTTNIEAPLWNKTLPATGTFQPYAKIGTTDGEIISSLSGTSLACLSCHDGSQAIDNMINAPGSGGYVAGGASKGWTAAPDAGGAVTVGAGNTFGATAAANIGGGTADLSNDHPIGIRYCGGGQTATTAGACVDGGFIAPTEYTVGAEKRYYVETGGNTTKEKTDIWLYNRTFAVAGNAPSVECASCHDVHSSNNLFMRYATDPNVGNKGSELCLACHIK